MASPSPAANPSNQPSEQQGGVGMNMDMDMNMNMNMNKGLKPSYSGPAINLMQQQYHQTPPSPLPYPITSYPSSYSSSYPPPTGPPFHLHPISSFPSPPPPALSPPTSVGGGAVLMDMLTNLNLNLSTAATSGPSAPPPPHRMLSSKLPKGRHLIGDRPVYDISVRLKGEVQPQLEVTPITKYVSDPALILGRQIAVNRSYICYGLKPGTIRILNINTALRALLRGHNQKVTDMAFFAEDVHLLASACVGGLVFVRKISEGPDEEDKPQIFEKIVLAIQIVADAELLHPRVCWHPHKQEILVVSIGKSILKIDTNKVGRGEAFSADKPLNCPIDKCIEGVQLVGKHASEVTELSMCQWMTTRLASASTDGTVKIWEDRKEVPLAILRPHDGNPVNSVSFLTAPHRPDHVVLVTGGPYNHEIKIWSSESEEGWLLPSDTESWRCSQTLILKSSGESSVEDAFFNKVVALPRAGLVLLANAKKNAIYAVHIDYGPYPATTRMDYIAEFTVTMPILSLTGTSDSLPNGEHVIQVYCVQKQAIQQYALDLAQCLPPPLEKLELEKTESNVSATFDAATSSGSSFTESSSRPVKMPVNKMEVPAISNRSESSITMSYPGSFASSEVAGVSDITSSSMQTKTSFMPLHNNEETTNAGSPLHPLSPRLSRKISGLLSPSRSAELIARVTDHTTDHAIHDYSVDPKMGSLNENVSDVPSAYTPKKGDKMVTETNTSLPEPPLMFKQPTHLITPSEILSRAVSSENSHIIQGMKAGETLRDVIIKNNAESNEVEVKVVGEARNSQDHDFDMRGDAHIPVVEKKEKSFYSQASDLSYQMTRDNYLEGSSVGRIREANEANVPEGSGSPLKNSEAEDRNMPKDASTKFNELKAPTAVMQSQEAVMKTKKTKEKGSEVSGPSSSSPRSLKSSHLSNELSCNSVVPCNDAALSQLSALQGTLNQLINMQKEMQKEMNTMISVPVSKQGKKLEASLGQSVEKVIKSNTDALWARFQEENMKHEKLEEDRALQLTNLINNCTSKDLPTEVEKILKKETAAIGPAVVRAIIPTLEKAISSAIVESFQKGVGDKAITQLEKSVNSKVEATFARQIQSQFQTSGKQVLQDALRSSLETSIIPAFEMSIKAMFDQVHATFQTGLVKHLNASLQQFDSMHSPLVNALRDTINSASSITQTMSGELADGQRKLLAIAASGANVGSPSSSFSNGPFTGLHEVAEASLDPTKELLRLIAEHKYEEAFTDALHRSNVTIVSWLCSQIDLQGILSMSPLPLSQRVLLALLQQLACDIGNETSKKLEWMRDVAAAINPTDPTIALHVRPIFEQVCQIVNHQRSLPSNVSASEASGIRILLLVINSVLASCK